MKGSSEQPIENRTVIENIFTYLDILKPNFTDSRFRHRLVKRRLSFSTMQEFE